MIKSQCIYAKIKQGISSFKKYYLLLIYSKIEYEKNFERLLLCKLWLWESYHRSWMIMRILLITSNSLNFNLSLMTTNMVSFKSDPLVNYSLLSFNSGSFHLKYFMKVTLSLQSKLSTVSTMRISDRNSLRIGSFNLSVLDRYLFAVSFYHYIYA